MALKSVPLQESAEFFGKEQMVNSRGLAGCIWPLLQLLNSAHRVQKKQSAVQKTSRTLTRKPHILSRVTKSSSFSLFLLIVSKCKNYSFLACRLCERRLECWLLGLVCQALCQIHRRGCQVAAERAALQGNHCDLPLTQFSHLENRCFSVFLLILKIYLFQG